MIRAAIQGIASCLRDGLDWREVAVEVQARMSDDAGFMCSAQGVRRLNGDIRSRGLRLDRPIQAERGVQWRQMAFASEAVLTALDTYLSRGGGSRGARAICDPDGRTFPSRERARLRDFASAPSENSTGPKRSRYASKTEPSRVHFNRPVDTSTPKPPISNVAGLSFSLRVRCAVERFEWHSTQKHRSRLDLRGLNSAC